MTKWKQRAQQVDVICNVCWINCAKCAIFIFCWIKCANLKICNLQCLLNQLCKTRFYFNFNFNDDPGEDRMHSVGNPSSAPETASHATPDTTRTCTSNLTLQTKYSNYKPIPMSEPILQICSIGVALVFSTCSYDIDTLLYPVSLLIEWSIQRANGNTEIVGAHMIRPSLQCLQLHHNSITPPPAPFPAP